jgi:hypothetical protein
MPRPLLVAVLLFGASSLVFGQGAGALQISRVDPTSIPEPSPCPPRIACENYSRVEVTRVGGTTGVVTVDIMPVGGTATLFADYDVAPSVYGNGTATLRFPDGSSGPYWIFIVPKADFLLEPPETVIVALRNPTGGATIGTPSTATVTILDTPAQLSTIPTTSPAGYAVLAGLMALIGSVLLLRAH